MDIIPKITLWYLLFPLNRIVPTFLPELAQKVSNSGSALVVREDHLALFIFLVSLAWYCHFAVGTVQQICAALNIWCFSIKSDKDKLK
jgi:hypothetical protein